MTVCTQGTDLYRLSCWRRHLVKVWEHYVSEEEEEEKDTHNVSIKSVVLENNKLYLW